MSLLEAASNTCHDAQHLIDFVYSTVTGEPAASPCNQQESQRLETAADGALLCFYVYV